MLPDKLRTIFALIAGVLLTSAAVAAAVPARTALDRDVQGYAVATCMAAQSEPFLRDQGDAWAAAIVQRGHGSIAQLAPLRAAVLAELAKRNIPIGREEAAPMAGKPLVVMYCAEIIDTPSVRTAIARARSALSRAYARH